MDAVMVAIATALLAAAMPDAGLPPAVYADRAQLELDLPDGGTLVLPGQCFATDDGGTACSGVWEPTPRAVALERLRADEHAQNAVLSAKPALFSVQTWVLVALTNLLTAAVIAYATWTVVRLIDGR